MFYCIVDLHKKQFKVCNINGKKVLIYKVKKNVEKEVNISDLLIH